jgi:hypothetical protein
MFKTIICFVLACLAYLEGESQKNVADSLRLLFEKINNIPADETGSCSKFITYKNNIAKIEPVTLGDALAKYIFADSQFIKLNKKSSCPVLKLIEDVDSIIKAARPGDLQDSIQILNAILYIKYGLLDSSFLRLQVSVLSGNNTVLRHPIVFLNSMQPFILTPGDANDSLFSEIYIRRGVSYDLIATDSGYISSHVKIIAHQDTAVTITLNAIGQDQENPPVIIPVLHNYWRMVSILLALGLIALIWKIFSDKKRQPPPDEAIYKQVNDNPAETERSRKLEESIALLNKKLKDKDDQINRYSSQSRPVNPGLNNTEHNYFLSELMMTAGPRKKRMSEPNADKDLGEDVCGFIQKGDDVLAWVLDGTSDFYCLRNPETQREYFSSRLLAQSIARELKSHFGEGRMEAFDQTMSTIMEKVKLNWMQAISQLPASEKEILKSNIKEGNFPECATTVIICSFSLNGELIVYRSGDSKMLVYGQSDGQKVYLNTTLSEKNPKSNDRVFFRLTLTPQGELDILHNKPIFEIVKMENISTIIGMSDGIGKKTEDDLKKVYPVNSDAMRTEIIYQVQGTEDDKSLFIIEIKNNT